MRISDWSSDVCSSDLDLPLSHEDARKIRLIMSLRGRGITSSAVLGALERVPRELFVDAAFMDQAWEDRALPIAAGQTVSQPFIVAFMTQALELTDRTKVLEIDRKSTRLNSSH